ncbi:MAG: hypothetical protein JWM44_870 [Bacilli bacterium]|nr:hypothetical protein [Bacilli bacterium]
MKQMILIIIIVLALSGCSNNNIKVETIITLNPTIEPSGTSGITPTSTVNPTITPTSTSSNKGVNLSESDALSLIKSKLDEESLRVSSLGIGGIDDNGNYIIRQSSKATTVVMEWYHVNPVSKEITCEILKDMCLITVTNSSLPTQTPDINSDHLKALELAKAFAKEKLSKFHYVEGITYIEFANEDNGKIVFHVYNPGSGMTDTIDWLTVDLEKNTVTAMFNKDINTVTKATYQKK